MKKLIVALMIACMPVTAWAWAREGNGDRTNAFMAQNPGLKSALIHGILIALLGYLFFRNDR